MVVPSDRPGKPRPLADAIVHVRGAKDAPSTDEDGRFWLILPPEMSPGDALTIDAEKEGYRLWQPSQRWAFGGAARVPTDLDKGLVELQLLPIGSKRFLSPPAIEALVTGMMARAREQIGRDAHPAEIRLDRYLREWATRYGFAFKEVKAAVDGWAAKVKNNRQSTPAQKSQAAFVRHELADAARFSHAAVAAAGAETTSFDKEEQALAARKRAHGDTMRELLKKEADADFVSLQFEPALEVYRRVLALIDKKDDPARFATASLDVARAEQQLAAGQTGASASTHLTRAAEACNDALQVYSREQFPKEWAAAENDLGTILEDQAKQTRGKAGLRAVGQGRHRVAAGARAVDARAAPRGLGRHFRQPEPGARRPREARARREGGRAPRARGRHAAIDAGGAHRRSVSRRVGGHRARARAGPGGRGRARDRRQERRPLRPRRRRLPFRAQGSHPRAGARRTGRRPRARSAARSRTGANGRSARGAMTCWPRAPRRSGRR